RFNRSAGELRLRLGRRGLVCESRSEARERAVVLHEYDLTGAELMRRMPIGAVIAAHRFHARAVRIDGHDLANAALAKRFKQNAAIAQNACRKHWRSGVADALRRAASERYGLDPEGIARVNDPVFGQIEGTRAVA